MARAEISVYFDLRRKRYDRLKKMSKDLGFSKSAILSYAIDTELKEIYPERVSTSHRDKEEISKILSEAP